MQKTKTTPPHLAGAIVDCLYFVFQECALNAQKSRNLPVLVIIGEEKKWGVACATKIVERSAKTPTHRGSPRLREPLQELLPLVDGLEVDREHRHALAVVQPPKLLSRISAFVCTGWCYDSTPEYDNI